MRSIFQSQILIRFISFAVCVKILRVIGRDSIAFI